MKKIIYMDGEPIQHPGVKGRELPIKICELFNELEAERIFISASEVEGFINQIFRIQSFEEAHNELNDCISDLSETKPYGIDIQNRLERRIRSYFLEADVFFSHWRRFLGRMSKRGSVSNNSKDVFKTIENQYKTDNTYALLRIIRNFVMHSGDIMHESYVGMNEELNIWADVNVLINDIRDRDDKKVLSNIGGRIDLIKLADESYPIVLEIHEKFLNSVVNVELINALENLVTMRKKILLYKSNTWYAIEYTGIKGVKPGLPIIGEVPGIGLNYRRLYWSAYDNLYNKMKNKGFI